MTEYALRAVDVRKAFGRRNGTAKVAVDGVSFDLVQGGSLGIVGESGAGKSTLARMLLGFDEPSSGYIELHGTKLLARASRAERRRRSRQIQMVYQDPFGSLDPRYSVEDTLIEFLNIHFNLSPVDRAARVRSLLEQVGLSARDGRSYPGSMSGGQCQRVAIARALAADPSVIVLDEPVSALDVSTQARVLNLLADIREETGVSYAFITHDLGVVRYVSDHIVVMRQGRIVEQGLTSEVLDAPNHEYTRKLRDAVPRAGWTPNTSTIDE